MEQEKRTEYNGDFITGYPVLEFEKTLDEKVVLNILQQMDLIKKTDFPKFIKHLRDCFASDVADNAINFTVDKANKMQGMFLALAIIEREINRMSEKFIKLHETKETKVEKNKPFKSITE